MIATHHSSYTEPQVAVLHGAGYVGGVLVEHLVAHPDLSLRGVTSRTFAGEPVHAAHSRLRGQTTLAFTDPEEFDASDVDALLVAAEHGQSVHTIPPLLDAGYDGPIVDLSADFRFADPALYETWFGYTHPAPDLLDTFTYGLPEVADPYPPNAKYVANPGCYATGISLALWPLARQGVEADAAVTALTGASGSGASPSSATHFPQRDGNVRAYKVLAHQHRPEIQQVLGAAVDFSFVPASGPWTHGIWGTAQITLGASDASNVADWFAAAYGDAPLVRCWPEQLPELQPVVGTPFCDVGWVVQGDQLVIGFALDNLYKGAATQAIQNLNRVLGLPETAGLLASDAVEKAHT